MRKKLPPPVLGTRAPPSRPTLLGAALVAIIITFPVALTIFLVDLLLL